MFSLVATALYSSGLLSDCLSYLLFISIHRDLPQRPDADTQACVSWLAHLMVRKQEEGCVVRPWFLMACLLLQAPVTVLVGEGLPWHHLSEKTLRLRNMALEFGVHLNWPGE